MRIGPPAHADIDALVQLGRLCHEESRFARLPYDGDRVAARLTQMVAQPLSTTFFMAAQRASGEVQGLMVGTIDEYFFCGQRVASSIFFLVHPAHRGGPAASKMVMAFRAWARARGAVEIYIGVASGVSVHSTGRFLAKMGLQLSGGNYSAWLPATHGGPDAVAAH